MYDDENLESLKSEHKSEHEEMKYLNNAQKNKIQQVKNSLSEHEKDVRELKDREMEIREELVDFETKS